MNRYPVSKYVVIALPLLQSPLFLLQVAMKGATNKARDRYLNDARGLLREKKIYYAGLGREGSDRERIVIRFREADQRAAALAVLGDQMKDLVIREQDIGTESALIATIKPEVVKTEQEAALQQNIQTLRNRVNELGVAEPIVQQQGADRIVVQLAGVQDPTRAKEILGRTATLEVRMGAEENAAGPGQDAFPQYRDQPAPFA